MVASSSATPAEVPQTAAPGRVLTWKKGRKTVTRTVAGPNGKVLVTKKPRAETIIEDGIRIRAVTKRTGRVAWRVEPPPSLGEPRREFADLEPAKGYALQIASLRRRAGKSGFELTDKQRVEALECFKLLEPSGASMRTAIEFFLRHSQPAAPATVADAVEAFLESSDFNRLRSRTQEDYRSRLRTFAACHPSRLASEVFPEQIGAFLNSNGDWSAQTRLNYWRVLHSFFVWCEGDAGAARKGCIPQGCNPVSKVSAPQTTGGTKPGIFMPAEIRALLETALMHPELKLGPVIALGAFCGLRPSEIERLDWSALHLDDAKPFIAIEREGTKGSFSDRNVEIPPCALAWLQAYGVKPSGRLLEVEDPRKRWRKLRDLAGLKDWPHDGLRHSFASHYFALHGVAATQAQLGHTTPATLFKHYRRLVKDAEAKAYFEILPPAEKPNVIAFRQTEAA